MLSKDEARDMVNKDRHERGECKQPCHYCELEEIKAEKRLESERISVNELSLANQELTEKVRLIQEHTDKLGELFIGQTAIRIGLEERIKELEGEKQRTFPSRLLRYCEEHKTICMLFDGQLACCLKARVKELESQLASIKGDESIGKLEVEGSFWEED